MTDDEFPEPIPEVKQAVGILAKVKRIEPPQVNPAQRRRQLQSQAREIREKLAEGVNYVE